MMERAPHNAALPLKTPPTTTKQQPNQDNEHSRKVAAQYASSVPAEGSAIDLLVRARNKETGEALKAHHIVAQANSILVAGAHWCCRRGRFGGRA